MEQVYKIAIKTLVVGLSLVSLQSCCGTHAPKNIFTLVASGQKENFVEEVSIIQLLSTPNLYEDKTIAIGGYIFMDAECEAIFFMPDFKKRLGRKEAVWLDLTEEWAGKLAKYNGKYCWAIGAFTDKNKGHFNMYAGSLTNILRISVFSPDGVRR
ncbi:MAG: hypothetical protein A2283_02345 [Lentisphaerae bacterium RIFOXYA12_FULL_48_11]|nr:MAG: hypothetical protein A2283_02345 [Lentisphaerae bacterium RIFOXYA12_FULL_48_11]